MLAWSVVQTDKDEHPRDSLFRPNGSLLPGTIFLDALRLGLIAPPLARLEFRDFQTFQVFLQRLANQSGSIQFLPLRRGVPRLQELGVEKDVNGLHCHSIGNTAFCENSPKEKRDGY